MRVIELNFRIPLSLARVDCLAISPFLKEKINNITVLINALPKVVLNPVDLDENFIDEKCNSKSPT